MLNPSKIAELQEKARNFTPESQEQIHRILKLAETAGRSQKLSHYFAPEALNAPAMPKK